MTDSTAQGFDWLRRELDRIIATYQTPPERRVGYGNLRHEYSHWKKESEEITNIAVIYETPGGSTTQLNVTYNHHDNTFAYLDDGLGDYKETQDPREILEFIHSHVEGIPEKRQAQLDSQVDDWMGQGKSSREVFGQLNKLLQEEFLGGRVTTNELKCAIQHAIKLKAQSSA
ncbi:MAG: hypothetical protein KBI47_04290 [Armatimonadetes bacterium]|nr:hypothetical protein [Armatimonadota bacterium]MDI9584196.1 hypothetical protein [Acidobacteriota bacterium]